MKEATEQNTSVTVKYHGISNIVVDQNVLLLIPAEKATTTIEEVSESVDQVKQFVQNSGIPINSCQSGKGGGLVIKFLS